MTLMTSAQFTAMLAVALGLCAAFTDVKARRIPNRLTYSAILAGLVLQTAFHGWRGLLLSAGGGVLFGGIFKIGRAHAELQSQSNLVCRLLLEKKKNATYRRSYTSSYS